MPTRGWRILWQMAAAVVVLVGLLLAAVGRSALSEWEAYRPPGRGQLERPLTEIGVSGMRAVEFAGPRGLVMRGWYRPPATGDVVILLHGSMADRSSLVDEMRGLAAGGLGFVAMDSPGHGLSDGDAEWGEIEREALRATVRWTLSQPGVDSSRLGVAGFSMGGYIAAQVAADEPRLRRVALLGTPPDLESLFLHQNGRFARQKWRVISTVERWAGLETDTLRPRDVVTKVAPRPVLVVTGADDAVVPPSLATLLFDGAAAPKQFFVVPRGQHLRYATVMPVEYPRCLRAFFGGVVHGDEPACATGDVGR